MWCYWLRAFVINKAEHSQALLQHINSQDPHIQFTVEPTQQGSLPFLDTLVTIEQDNTFSTSVYWKPTHTDQYLNWGQQPTHHSKTKCFQHISSQGQGSLILTRQTWTRTTTHQDSTTSMPVPKLGPQPIAPTSLQTTTNQPTSTTPTTTNRTTTQTKGTLP